MKFLFFICSILLIISCKNQNAISLEELNDSILSSNNTITSKLERIEISDYAVRNDTLWILSGDKFLYYPFGVHKDVDELTAIYPFLSKQQLLNNKLDNLYFNRTSIIFVPDIDNSKNLEIVYVKIADPDIVLVNGMQVGLNKSEFMNYLSTSLLINDWEKINVVVLESELLGVWNYYYFSNTILDSIVFKTDYQFNW
jgi:hypothetical protein